MAYKILDFKKEKKNTYPLIFVRLQFVALSFNNFEATVFQHIGRKVFCIQSKVFLHPRQGVFAPKLTYYSEYYRNTPIFLYFLTQNHPPLNHRPIYRGIDTSIQGAVLGLGTIMGPTQKLFRNTF
jgi:hypothetical protein